MNEPKRHHFIPEFYLKQWTGADGNLFSYYRTVSSRCCEPVRHVWTAPICQGVMGGKSRCCGHVSGLFVLPLRYKQLALMKSAYWLPIKITLF